MQGHDIALVAGQFAKVGSSKSAGMNFRLTPEMLEKFTSTGKRRFGRKVKEFVPTDGFKAVFNEVGVRLKQQQTTNQFDPEQMWSYVCGLFLGARRKIATAGVGVLVLWLGFHVIFGANGMVVYQGKRSEYKKLQ